MKSFFFALSLLLFALDIGAQSDFKPGFIITLEEDTITGFVDYRNKDFNAGKCVFKNLKDGDEVKYYPRDIKAYGINGEKFYIARQIETDAINRIVFLEQLVDGKADLYFLPPKVFFIETAERGFFILQNTKIKVMNDKWAEYGQILKKYFLKDGNEYIAILKISFQDKMEIMEEVNKVEFNQVDLIEITMKYHDLVCPEEKCIVYSKSKPRSDYFLGFTIGMSNRPLHLDYYSTAETAISIAGTGIVAGLQIDSYNTGSSERIFSTIYLNYSHVKYDRDSEPYVYLISNMFQVGGGLHYIYPRYRIKPFFGVGFEYALYFQNEESHLFTAFRKYNPGGKSLGPTFCAGTVIKVKEKINITIQSRYFIDAFRTTEDSYYYRSGGYLNTTFGLAINLGI